MAEGRSWTLVVDRDDAIIGYKAGQNWVTLGSPRMDQQSVEVVPAAAAAGVLKLEAEVVRLRALIEDAPHEELCMTNLGRADACDCWKREANAH